jgi:hypothetical protein
LKKKQSKKKKKKKKERKKESKKNIALNPDKKKRKIASGLRLAQP